MLQLLVFLFCVLRVQALFITIQSFPITRIKMNASRSLQLKATATTTATTMFPRAAVSVVVKCHLSSPDGGKDYFLLVQRGRDPGKGKWSFPGGKIQWGESTLQAAMRELHEETKWEFNPGTGENSNNPRMQLEWYHGTVCTSDSIGPAYHYMIAQCYAHVTSSSQRIKILPKVQAADDAADAGWWTLDDMSTLDTTPGLDVVIGRTELLSQQGMLPTVPV